MGSLFACIDGGSTAVKAAVADEEGGFVYEAPYLRHFGQVARSIEQVLGELYRRYPNIADVSFTGYNTVKLAKALGAKHFPDYVAQKTGVLRLHPGVGAAVHIGGQGSGLMFFKDGEEVNTFLNSACAAGTGSFIERQAVRNYKSQLGTLSDPALKIEEALRLLIEEGMKSLNPALLAARCPVFTETDMIHKANSGGSKADIFAGLAEALARNCTSDLLGQNLLGQKEIPEGEQLLIGGCALNPLLLRYLRNFFPKLAVPGHATSIQAYGAALLGIKRTLNNPYFASNSKSFLEGFDKFLRVNQNLLKSGSRKVFPVSGLESIVNSQSIDRASRLVISRSILPEDAPLGKGLYNEAWLGFDVGSTTTKCILYALDGRGVRHIFHKEYINTEGAPLTAVNKLNATIQSNFTGLKILGVGVTGSGRMVAGSFVGGDVIVDEITAHTTAAVYHNPKVDTVIEIGGQDSKYILVVDGHPVDFTMNKSCAAGTGSFLEKLATELGIDIKGEFQKLALSAEHPVKLSEKCTVFTYTAVTSALHDGASLAEICAGLAIALADNYRHHVVGPRPIGKDVMFLGGPSRNKAVVAALEQLLTDSTIIVPPHSEVFGAFGAAMCAEEKMRESGMPESAFRGFGIISEQPSHRSLKCEDRDCGNGCTLDQYLIPVRGNRVAKVIFGGTCGRHENGPPGVAKATDYSLESRALFKEMAGVQPRNGASQRKRKVLLPMHLYMHQLGVLWAHFFNELGIQPVLGRETTSEMIELGTRSTPNSFCISRIASTGHIAVALRSIGDNTFLFLPTIIDVPSPDEHGQGLYCPLVAASRYTTGAALSMDGKVLSPVIHLKENPKVLAHRMRDEFKSKLCVNQEQIQRALEEGLAHQREYERKLTGIWEKAEAEIGNGPAMVVLGRPYMLGDKWLSRSIFSEIAKLGVPAMPMDILPVSGIDIGKYGNMYWALGARILEASRRVRKDPRLFPVSITNFNCGPDSFLDKLVSTELAGKPSLELEIGENTARAGLVTRLQAFHNVIKSYLKKIL